MQEPEKIDTVKYLKFLQKIKNEVREDLIKSVTINDNEYFNCRFNIHDNHLDYSVTGLFRFDLNGKEFIIEETVERDPSGRKATVTKLLQKLKKLAAEKIASAILEQSFDEYYRENNIREFD